MLEVSTRNIYCPALSALAVLAVHSGFEFRAALVGGAVRDAYHGIEQGPLSDQDVAVFGAEANAALPEIEEAMRNAGYTEKARFSDSGEYADGQIWLVVKYEHSRYPQVDLLFHPLADTIEDVLDTFDYNINQFAAVYAEPEVNEVLTAYYHGRLTERLPGQQPLGVLQSNVPVDAARTAKMVRIADALGWAVPPSYRE